MIYGGTRYACVDAIDSKTSDPSITSSDEEHCLVLEYTAWESGIYLRTNQKINSVLVHCRNVHGILSVEFEVLMAVRTKMAAFLVVAPSTFIPIYMAL
jgi:hypothetical protein